MAPSVPDLEHQTQAEAVVSDVLCPVDDLSEQVPRLRVVGLLQREPRIQGRGDEERGAQLSHFHQAGPGFHLHCEAG